MEVMGEARWVEEEDSCSDPISKSCLVDRLWSGLTDQWLRDCLTTHQRKNKGRRRGWPFTLRLPAQILWTPSVLSPCGVGNEWLNTKFHPGDSQRVGFWLVVKIGERNAFSQKERKKTFGPKCERGVKRKEEHCGIQKARCPNPDFAAVLLGGQPANHPFLLHSLSVK